MPFNKRVTINRAAMDQVDLALADGLFDWGVQVLQSANVPDAPPLGVGLLQGGGVLAFHGRKKINGTTIGGKAISKPRAAKLQDGGVTVIVGFGYPGRFVELGTVDTPAEPFLTPAFMSNRDAIPDSLKAAVSRRIRK